MALPLTVGSPVGALVATSLTGDGEGGCSLLIPLSLPQWTARGGEMVLPNGAAGWEGACGCVGDWGLCRGRVIQILPRWNKNASFPGSSSLGQEKEAWV